MHRVDKRSEHPGPEPGHCICPACAGAETGNDNCLLLLVRIQAGTAGASRPHIQSQEAGALCHGHIAGQTPLPDRGPVPGTSQPSPASLLSHSRPANDSSKPPPLSLDLREHGGARDRERAKPPSGQISIQKHMGSFFKFPLPLAQQKSSVSVCV